MGIGGMQPLDEMVHCTIKLCMKIEFEFNMILQCLVYINRCLTRLLSKCLDLRGSGLRRSTSVSGRQIVTALANSTIAIMDMDEMIGITEVMAATTAEGIIQWRSTLSRHQLWVRRIIGYRAATLLGAKNSESGIHRRGGQRLADR